MVKNLPANAGDPGLIPGSGRSPGEGNGNPLQYSCLGNPMDREAWRASWGCRELGIAEGHAHTHLTFLSHASCVDFALLMYTQAGNSAFGSIQYHHGKFHL